MLLIIIILPHTKHNILAYKILLLWRVLHHPVEQFKGIKVHKLYFDMPCQKILDTYNIKESLHYFNGSIDYFIQYIQFITYILFILMLMPIIDVFGKWGRGQLKND